SAAGPIPGRSGTSTPRCCSARTNLPLSIRTRESSCGLGEMVMQYSGIGPACSRRELLRRMGGGFGAVGLASVLGLEGAMRALAPLRAPPPTPLAPRSPPFAPRANRVIFLFMNGGPSHVDTFAPKPMLTKHDGERPPEAFRVTRKRSGTLMASPFSFRKYGES